MIISLKTTLIGYAALISLMKKMLTKLNMMKLNLQHGNKEGEDSYGLQKYRKKTMDCR